jgi:2-desacetyl-2-hydroxyethyl bacteriochlorophyllide A dehydrogenase
MEIRAPKPKELLVRTICSAISPGTEMLVYRGQAPEQLTADSSIASLGGTLDFPLQYGYAAVGEVIQAGTDISPNWLGKLVFSFQPHQTHFTAIPAQVILLPDGIPPETGVFLPNMETAINFVMDGRPVIGERTAVFGQGIVGLLTTALLSRFPLNSVMTLDKYPSRRAASLGAGATHSYDPTSMQAVAEVRGSEGLDLVFELSGSPTALDQAIEVTGYAGRVVIGSWYGRKRASLNLGGHFHRSRIQLITSQVSSIDPGFTGRWDKPRRYDLAWEMIRRVQPDRWITHRMPFEEAERGYSILDEHPEDAIQVIFMFA